MQNADTKNEHGVVPERLRAYIPETLSVIASYHIFRREM